MLLKAAVLAAFSYSGYPMYQRAVAQLLRTEVSSAIPLQRIVGAGGEIKLRGDAVQIV